MNISGESSIAERFLEAKRALFDKLYSSLNPAQRESVFSVKGPLLVLAGAGSGKTTVLTKRIAFIIKYGNSYYSDFVPDSICEDDIKELEDALSMPDEDKEKILSQYAVDPCPPWAMLSITFTNKAANEMKTRLAREVGTLPDGNSSDDIWAGTFHSMCMRLLRKYPAEAGLKPGFTIYDTDDCKRVITHIMKDLGIDEKTLAPRAVLNHISRAKDKLYSPEKMAEESGRDFAKSKSAEIYKEYQRILNDSNVLDFDDIIMRTVLMLRSSRDVKDYCTHRFKYICVDEFQDTNEAQFDLISELSDHYRNIMAVGDDDQSIYKFRGARIENILGFDKAFENTKVVKLEQNYRSTGNILGAANAVISHNESRKGKTLFTDRGAGDKVILKKLDNQNEEARYIINKIMTGHTSEGRNYSDFAVLYRINAQSNSLENVFNKSGIPYRILGGVRFYERKEIKDIIAYLCVVNNPGDNLRLRRIINEPKRKIGETTVNAVEQIALSEGISMFEVMRHTERYVAIAKYAPKLRDFTLLIEKLQQIAESEPLPTLIDQTIELSGYRQMLLESTDGDLDRLENVQELISNAVSYEEEHENATLESFLEDVALVSDVDNYDANADAVVLMTIHSAKGLEFPVVFVPGFEEGIFPGMQASLNPEDLEEERRLAYVAITRAKDKLYCSHVRERLMFGRTQYNHESRFLKEIPDEFIDSDYLKRQKEVAEAKAAADRDRAENGGRSQRSRKPVISKEFFKEPEPFSASHHATGSTGFAAGDIVSHSSFGRGEILSAKNMGGDVLYEIAFDKAGTKKLMATYAKLKKYGE